ncbi:MAG: hypothetical protein AAF481_02800 [Acidobacteriota bacterium]
MWRSIAAVVAGYLVMALWVMITLSLAWVLLGAEFAFHEGTFGVTAGWMVLNLLMGVIGALLGGWVAALIGRSWGPVKVLVAVVLVLGVLSAVLQRDKPEPPPELEVTTFEAAAYAQQPAWYPWLITAIGAGGTVLGARFRLRPE